MSFPKARSCRSGSSSTGPHRVNLMSAATRRTTAMAMAITASRDCASRFRRSDATATVPQNASVTCGPRKNPLGSCGLLVRTPAIQVNGSDHWSLSMGPWGPLLVALLSLAPMALVGEPLERAALLRIGRYQLRPRGKAPERLGGVVAAEP